MTDNTNLNDLNASNQELDRVIREHRENVQRERLLAREADERARLQNEQSRILTEQARQQSEVNNIQNEINNNNAEEELQRSRSRLEENNDDVRRKLADAKREKIEAESELVRAKAKKTLDQNDLEIAKFQARNNKEELHNMEVFATSMEQVRESLKGSVTGIFDSINNAIKFDIRRKPITGGVALLGLGANSLATQDKIPPIYGMLTKLIGTFATISSFYAGKGFERLFKSEEQRQLEELIQLNPVLKEVSQVNKQLAIEMAKLKLDKFNQSVKERFEVERNNLFERQQNNSERRVIINRENNVSNNFVSNNKDINDRLDSIIEIIKNIENQFDPEKDVERYNEEIAFRKELLNLLTNEKNPHERIKSKENNKFSLLETIGLASVGSTITGILTSISKFLLPMKAFGLSLLRFTPMIAGVTAVLMTLDFQKDLIKPIDNIKKLFDSGEYLEGILRTITMPADILSKFVLRSISFVSGIFGFDDFKNKISELADTTSLYDSLLTLKNNIFSMFQNIVKEMMLFSENFSLSGLVKDSIKSIEEYFNNFKLVDSIKELLDFVHDKFESLKFWKKDKEYRLSENRSEKSIIAEQKPNNILSNEKTTKELITSNNQVNNRFESVSKINTQKLTEQQNNLKQVITKKENERIEKIVEKNSSIVAPITNTQFNMNNQTAIASRPRARIEENTAMRNEWNNRNADYSGYVIG